MADTDDTKVVTIFFTNGKTARFEQVSMYEVLSGHVSFAYVSKATGLPSKAEFLVHLIAGIATADTMCKDSQCGFLLKHAHGSTCNVGCVCNRGHVNNG